MLDPVDPPDELVDPDSALSTAATEPQAPFTEHLRLSLQVCSLGVVGVVQGSTTVTVRVTDADVPHAMLTAL